MGDYQIGSVLVFPIIRSRERTEFYSSLSMKENTRVDGDKVE